MIKVDELVRLCNDYVVNGIKVQHDGESYDVYDFDMDMMDNNIILLTKRSNNQIIVSAVNEVMEVFNFERVHKVMECINWTYYDGKVPDVDRLKKTVRELLLTAFNGFFDEFGDKKYDTYKSYISETGGFRVEVGSNSYTEDPTATVSFIVEQF